MKKILFSLMIGLSSLAVTGCVTQTDYNQKSMVLAIGMDKGTVIQILGTPRRTDVNPERERWIYWNKSLLGLTVIDSEQLAQDRLVVTFVNGKLEKWGQQTITDDIVDSTAKSAAAYSAAFSKPSQVEK